ncbi:succinate dehydrogenase / fumarate reductase, cytochrome b subunit [Azospirillaceae bacterium]
MTQKNSATVSVWRSFIMKKFLVALTGAFLCFFLLVHVSGSALVFVGPEAFNQYTYFLAKSKIIVLVEFGLLAGFALHAALAGKLAVQNWRSRNRNYAVLAMGPKQAGIWHRTMIWQGVLILAFLLFHLATIKFGPKYAVVYDGVSMRDMYRVLVEAFSNPVVVFGYCLTVSILGVHLFHGVASIFQTLGVCQFQHPIIFRIAQIYALFVASVFFLEPLYVFFFARPWS